MKNKRCWKICSILACILWMIFIFHNSSQDGNSSYSFSGKFLDKIIEIKDKLTSSTEGGLSNFTLSTGEIMAVNLTGEGNLSSSNNLSLSILPSFKGLTRSQQNDIIRKYAHAFEFFILAILFANVLFAFNFRGKKAIIYVLFAVLFYACTDEYHQMYVPGRNSSIKDVFIDFAGGIFGLCFYYILFYTKEKTRKFFK